MEALAEHVGALLFIYILPATLGGKCNLVACWAHRLLFLRSSDHHHPPLPQANGTAPRPR